MELDNWERREEVLVRAGGRGCAIGGRISRYAGWCIWSWGVLSDLSGAQVNMRKLDDDMDGVKCELGTVVSSLLNLANKAGHVPTWSATWVLPDLEGGV